MHQIGGPGQKSPLAAPAILVQRSMPPNTEGLGSISPGGVASLPPHPASQPRANHADKVGGEDTKCTQTQTHTHTHTLYCDTRKPHEYTHTHTRKHIKHAWGRREGQRIAPQSSFLLRFALAFSLKLVTKTTILAAARL